MTILAKKVMDEGWLNIFMRPYFTRRVAAEFFSAKMLYNLQMCWVKQKKNIFKQNVAEDFLFNVPLLIRTFVS